MLADPMMIYCTATFLILPCLTIFCLACLMLLLHACSLAEGSELDLSLATAGSRTLVAILNAA